MSHKKYRKGVLVFLWFLIAPIIGAISVVLLQNINILLYNFTYITLFLLLGGVGIFILYLVFGVVHTIKRFGKKVGFPISMFSILFTILVGIWSYSSITYPLLNISNTLMLAIGAPTLVVYYEKLAGLISKGEII